MALAMGSPHMSKSLVHKPRRPKRPTLPIQTADAPVEAQNDQNSEEPSAFIERDRRHALIAEHAYYLAEQRGFEPGHELDDWLTAETNVEQAFASSGEESRLCGE